MGAASGGENPAAGNTVSLGIRGGRACATVYARPTISVDGKKQEDFCDKQKDQVGRRITTE
jgi:hypothetical protein